MTDLLEVKDLSVQFKTFDGIVHAVNGISFSLKEGEVLGIVGESGCGKSVSMLSLMRLLPPNARISSESANFKGKDLFSLPDVEMRNIRGNEIGIIFQDPMTSLNPVLTIGYQLCEMLKIHKKMSKKEAEEHAKKMLRLVGIPEPEKRLNSYPHQFSGGMRQRVMIAMSLACDPKILIADEPTTALDVTIQAQIIDLVKKLRDELGMAIIWITHDLGVAAGLSQKVIVMYGGQIVEKAEVEELFEHPSHPYTLGLLNSLPRVDILEKQRLVSIDGTPPILYDVPKYCPFNDRCKFASREKKCENPELREVRPGHFVACSIDVESEREK